MTDIFAEMIPPVKPEHVIKLAVGPRKLTKGWTFSTWEAILSEIIVGDALVPIGSTTFCVIRSMPVWRTDASTIFALWTHFQSFHLLQVRNSESLSSASKRAGFCLQRL